MEANTLSMNKEHRIKQYKRRWVILFVFVIYATNGGCQSLQFSIIQNIIIKYYNGVSPHQVEWTANINSLSYVVLIVPSLYLLDKLGIRYTLSIASAGICVGAWIKLFSVPPDRFYLVLLGQGIVASSTIFTFGLAARFTAVWFGAHEISRAGAFALLGDQLGSSLAFLFPTLMVHDHSDTTIRNGLRNMHFTIAVTSTIIFILIVLLFKDQPKQPASLAQAIQKETETVNIIQSLIKMGRNRAFMMITFSYSLGVGSSTALWNLFNELILINFPESKREAGNIGFIIMFAGMLSSPVFAYILDRTRKFKQNAVILCFGAFVSLILFSVSLKSQNMIYVYCIAIIVGIFVQSLYVTGVQMGIEVTYPMSEAVCSAMMLFWAQLLGFIMTLVYSTLLKAYGDVRANTVLCSLFFLGAVVSLLIPANLKRQKAENTFKARELKEFLPSTNAIN